jgi:RHS repeat-associated protein
LTTLIHSAYNAWGQKNYLYPANFNNELHRFGYNARWGYRTDTETGLVYCQNRYYDPANGRWVTRDPIGYAGGVNLYGYCESGPVGATDPWGLYKLIILGDTSGLPAGDVGGVVVGNPETTDKIVSSNYDKEKLKDLIAGADEVVFYGHGSGSGEFLLPGTTSWTDSDVRDVIARRKKLGKGKLKAVWLRYCWSGEKSSTINLWLQIAELVVAYADVTGQKFPPAIFSPENYRSPIKNDPGKRNHGNGPKGKKGAKARDKPKKNG